MSAAHNDPAPRRRGKARVPDEPLTEAEQDAMEALGWRPAGGGLRRDGAVYITARAPDDSRHERTRAEWRAAIAAGERAPGREEPMSTETIPELPEIPPDLFGWEWELSDAGDARLTHPAEGYATSWGPAGPDADYGGRLGEARKRVAADVAVAAEERALIVAGDEPGGLPQLSTTMQRHVDRALAADRKGGEALWEKATAVADARVDAQRYGEWGLFLEATGLQERAAQRLVAIATRGRADGRFRDAVITGWLSFSVAHLTAQADDALIEQLLAAPVAPSKRQVEQLIAPKNPSPGTGSWPAPRPPTPAEELAEAENIDVEAAQARLDGRPIVAPPIPAPAPAVPWAADHDKTAYADYVRRFDRCGAVLTCTAPGRAPYMLHIAGRARPVQVDTWAELQRHLAAAERLEASGPTAPAPAFVAGLDDAPLTDAELAELSRLGGWELDLSRPPKPGKVLLRLCRGDTWDHTEERSADGWRYELRQLQAAEEAKAARAARPGEDPAPALPAGWSWRPRGDGAVQAWDGTIAHMTACHRPGQEAEAAAEAWRKAGGAAQAPPLTPPEYDEWAERARAAGATLTRDEDWRYVLALPDGSIEPREGWISTIARIRGLEVDSPPPASAEAEEPDAVPVDQRPQYAAAERALVEELAAATPRLRRLLYCALATPDEGPTEDGDALFDLLTEGLLMTVDEALEWALAAEGATPARPAPRPAPEQTPTLDGEDDYPEAFVDLTAELLGAEIGLSQGAAPELAQVDCWQAELDALIAELDDEAYERVAHRIGELRRAAREGVTA